MIYYQNDNIVVAITSDRVSSTELSKNYYFKLCRNGNLYIVCDEKDVDKDLSNDSWIKQHGIKIKLLNKDTQNILGKTKEIYNLYHEYKPELVHTNTCDIHILYQNKYIIRNLISSYPQPYAHMTGPQITELVDILTEVCHRYGVTDIRPLERYMQIRCRGDA